VRARRLGQALLIFVPLLICGMRLHSRVVGTPTGVTQEVARCLNLVRIAVARRNGKHTPAGKTAKPGTQISRTIS
jgi:hypothetical protein